MKKENLLMFTSLLGVMFLYFYLFTKTLGREKKLLRNELVMKTAFPVMVGIMIPTSVFLSILGSLPQNQELLRNVLNAFILLWVYVAGMLIVKSLLKWKRDRLDQWSELNNYTIGRRLP
ncbi:MAG: hypothetical protein IJO50_04510 [Clostridia bacterium]|nr:hypothetical protein [Clostridia bacterium]